MLYLFLYRLIKSHVLFGLFLSSLLLPHTITLPTSNPRAAWKSLKKSNERFVKNPTISKRRSELLHAQNPPYVLVSCSDSRVPPESIFDQLLGSLFVVRIAGNVIDNLVIDSIEFAVSSFSPSVIVVLGHSGCGAVTAAFNHLKDNNSVMNQPYGHLGAVLNPIENAILQAKVDLQSVDGLESATKANIRYSADKLVAGSPMIANAIKKGTLIIVGAEYSLKTGKTTELFTINK